MTVHDLANVLARIPDDVAAELRDALTDRLARLKPSRAVQLDQRDEQIRSLARDYYGDARSRQEAARRIARDLLLYRPGPPGSLPARRAAALARVLSLCEGKAPGRYQVENILAGHRRPKRTTRITK